MASARGLLHEDEELLAEMRPHPVVVVGPVLLFVVALAGAVTIALRYPGAPIVVAWLLAAMVGLPALWAAARILRWRSVRFFVTTSRLLYRRGLLGRDVVQLRLQRVAEVHCRQTVGARLIGAGRLVFDVAGADSQLVVDDVRRPRRLQRVITAQLDRLEVPYGAPAYDAYDAYGTAGTAGYGQAGYGGPGGGYGPGGYGYGAQTAQQSAVAPRTPSWSADASGPQGRRPARGRSWSDTPPHGVALGDEEAAHTVPGQILQLDELRRRGILSDDEFAAKKAELLGRL